MDYFDIMKAIRDLVNGNLNDAKRSAKHRTTAQLTEGAMIQFGLPKVAEYAVKFLRGKISFQRYCEATQSNQ